MDTIHPNLSWIKGRCYRVLDYETKYNEERKDPCNDLPGAVNNKPSTITSDDETCDIDFKIDRSDNGQYSTLINIPDAIRGIVIGSKGSTRKRIQSETGAVISFPPQGFEDDTIIKGSSREAVAAARRRMESMANSARRRHEPTHFLSLPLNCTQIINGFTQFKKDVLHTCSKERGIVPEIFQKAQKLHLTIGTLVLLNDFERKNASSVLNKCADRIVRLVLEDKPLKIQVKGIEYMNDDPAEVDVLYAKVFSQAGSNRKLQNLADQLVEEFVSAGIMNKDYSSVKLHVTVMNSIFNRSYATTNSRKKRETFDARMILKVSLLL